MKIEFWVDPGCPFCWTTARWVVDEVLPNRDLDIEWRPISLLFKNQPPEGSPYFAGASFTHGLLRVVESVRTADGNDGVFKLYWELGARIHHDGERHFDPADALTAVGLDPSHATAFGEERWDDVIRASMDDGLSLTGPDVGTPIIAMENTDGDRVAYFGPVITRVPDTKKSLSMWDALVEMMDIDSFFELKRSRTEAPNPGERPAPR